MESEIVKPAAQILYDINRANLKNGLNLREITIVVNVADTNDCAKAIALLGQKLAHHNSNIHA